MKTMIPYGRQSINMDDIEAVTSALNSEFLTTGPLVPKFESHIGRTVGAPAAVVSSGTAALHCAYSAIELGPGDEVITPPITFVATQATAVLLGARIVFADVLADTGNINPQAVEAVITRKTKAIVAVDYAGHPADLLELRNIANRHGIYLIEDAAHSFGSRYRGQSVGSIADLTTFSFFPTKNLTTCEGGAVSSINPILLERVKKFSRQGIERDSNNFELREEGPWHQEVQNFGLNYRLPDVLCALGISQLSRLNEFKTAREKVFDFYEYHLKSRDWIVRPAKRSFVDVNWHLYPIQVPAQKRRIIFEYLRDQGIGVQVNYLPVYRHPVFQDFKIIREDFPASEGFYASEISLPMSANLSASELERVVQALGGAEKFLKD